MTEKSNDDGSWWTPLGLSREDINPLLGVCKELTHVHDDYEYIRRMFEKARGMQDELVFLAGVCTALKVMRPEIRRQIIEEMQQEMGARFLKSKHKRL